MSMNHSERQWRDEKRLRVIRGADDDPMSGDTVGTLKADLARYDASRNRSILGSCWAAATLVRKLVKARMAEG